MHSSKITLAAFLLFVLLLNGCKLLTIESAQTPLSTTDLNIRLRTQAYVVEASERIERAADSLIANSADQQIRINALKWKIYAVSNFGKVGFQTSPKIAMMDTWALMLEMDQFLNDAKGQQILGDDIDVIRRVNTENLRQIEAVATNMLKPSDFEKHKAFVYKYVETTEYAENGFVHTPIRESYLEFKQTPDSLAVSTVGSLSEVVADFSNRMSYTSDKAGKQIRWNTQLMLAENGYDSASIKGITDSLNARVDALVEVAANTPDLLDDAIASFAEDMKPLFSGLRYELSTAMTKMGEERAALDTIIARERQMLDSLVARERAILVEEANTMADDFANDVMVQVKDMVSSILFYIALILAIILFIPFGLGYVTGKAVQTRKSKKA